MKVLSLDIAKTTGWSLWEDNELLHYGTLVLKEAPKYFKTKHEYYEALRISFFNKLNELIDITEPMMILIETPQGTQSATASNMFQLLHTVATIVILRSGTPKEYISASTWKKYWDIYGIGTKEAKEKSIELAQVKDHNIADSILMYKYWYEKNR